MSQTRDLAAYTFTSRYAKFLPDFHRRETWKETVGRSRLMHLLKYADKNIEAEIEEVFSLVEEKKVVGAMRTFQFAGDPILRKNERGFNCWGTYCNRLRSFQEAFFILLCGGGVGMSVQKHHIAWLPNLSSRDGTLEDKVYTISDDIEGWADALGVLLSSYFEDPINPEFARCNVRFVYDKIRPKGAPFSHGCGTAPGPEPLGVALERIRNLLDRAYAASNRLRPIDAYDIIMHASDAVLSGGIRRSATLILFSRDDQEMMEAKTGNWRTVNPQRGRSNNSVLLLRGKTTREEFLDIIQHSKQFGEPGFYWADSTESIPNPCVEIGFYCYDTTVDNYKETPEFSGWQPCNLSSINGVKIKSRADFLAAARAAAIIGTLQAGYTDFPYLGAVTERIARREALLGVSATGWMNSPEVMLDPQNMRDAAAIVVKTNRELAPRIGIRPAARATCNKPEGTWSTVAEADSGVSPAHAPRYMRRVQENDLSPPVAFYQKANPRAVERSCWAANKTDSSVIFCCVAPKGSKFKDDFTAIEFLDVVRSIQDNWVTPGKTPELCTKEWLSHNVSNTVPVGDGEWEAAANHIYDHRNSYAGVTLMSRFGDKDYEQAPFTAVPTAAEMIERYGDACMFASGLIEGALALFEGRLWLACDTALGIAEDLSVKGASDYEEVIRVNKKGWCDRLSKFARKYCKNDLKEATYLLKDVYNLKLWDDIVKEHKSVDFTEMIETTNNTSAQATVACAGGACALI